jgi:hypothetical protein
MAVAPPPVLYKKGMLSRRSCLSTLAAAGWAAAENRILGQGQHRYRVVPGWGVLDEQTPVKNCHGMVRDAEGHLILLTDHVANNVIVYDKPDGWFPSGERLFPERTACQLSPRELARSCT